MLVNMDEWEKLISATKGRQSLNAKIFLRWEFIKENKKVRKQENTLSTKKATKKKKYFFLTFLFFFKNSHL